jgi:hypothetical protein
LAAGLAVALAGGMLLRSNGPRFEGAASYVALGEATRGGEGPIVLALPANQPAALLAVQAVLRGRPEGAVEFRIEREDGGAVVWRTAMPAPTVSSWVERHGAVLLSVPRDALPPGRYRLSVGGGEGTLLLRSFEVRPAS